MSENRTLTVHANDVQAGDLLLLPGKQFTAETVDAKVKWVTISGSTTDGTPKSHRAERGWMIAVVREMETREERVARETRQATERYEFVRTDLFRQAQRAFTDQKEAVDSLVDNTSRGYRISDRDVEKVQEAALRVDFWAHVLRYVGVVDEEQNVTVDLGLAFLIVRNAARNDLLENRYRASSTSAYSNAAHDLAREVLTKFATDRYGGGLAKIIEEHWNGYELDKYDSGALSLW